MKGILYCIIVINLLFSGCTNWLEVENESIINEKTLFNNPSGYYQALNGVYSLMLSESTYGGQLSGGFIDILAQYWFISSKANDYYAFSSYNYETSFAQSTLENCWSSLYNTIGQTNLILENLERCDSTQLPGYPLLKGETHGLRAYLHLDLLRLFGPTIQNGLFDLAIPYRTTFSKYLEQFGTTQEVLDKIEKDLLIAYRYLKHSDPMVYHDNIDRSMYLSTSAKNQLSWTNRTTRMNYFAVAASLARFYQLKGEEFSHEAQQYALEVIECEKKISPQYESNSSIHLLAREEIIAEISRRDLLFSSEIVFGLKDPDLQEKLGVLFGYESGNGILPIRSELEEFLYNNPTSFGSPKDYRKEYWFYKGIENRYLLKYKDMSTEERPHTGYHPIIPMIRITEMYHIVIESLIGKDNAKALELLNHVRQSRNLAPILNTANNEALKKQLIYEMRKDYIGEGKMFYVYKRLFHEIYLLESSVTPSEAIFTLPIPISEYEFGNN